MANLKETATWESGIYQIEQTDPVIGGENGIDNKPLKQLANRTQYLKTEQDKLKNATAAATTAKSGITMLSSSVTSTGETKAATEKAAKTAYDKGVEGLNKANSAHILAGSKWTKASASTTVEGVTMLSSSVTSIGETKAATEKAVKTAYDRAQAAYSLANGKANATHTHTMAAITGLAPALALKANLASPELSGTPTAPTASATTNTDQIATTKFVKTAIAQIVGSAPAALDTLQELSAALGGDANLKTTLLNEIGKKATKSTSLAGYGITDFVLKTLTTEDLDTIKVVGFYKQDTNTNATTTRHYPEAKAGSLEVRISTFGWQHEYTVWDSGRKYVRNVQLDGSWGLWKRIDAVDSVPTARVITAGNGLTGGGNLTASRTLTLGTPNKISATSTNAVTAESHTHAIDRASTSVAGIVQLSNSISGTSETKAATEKALKDLGNIKASLASPTFTGSPKAPTPAKTVNDTTIATTAYVKQLIADLVGGAPAALDTLKEIATALGNNASLSATLTAAIGKKADLTAVVTKDQLIGIPLPYPKAQVPTGFVALTGQAISQSTYPNLYALYGARLPDLRGEFIRGWDNGRGIDTGRSILSTQKDSFKKHVHFLTSNYLNNLQTAKNKDLFDLSTILKDTTQQHTTLWNDGDSGDNGWVKPKVSSKIAEGDIETRPRNIAMQYICLAG